MTKLQKRLFWAETQEDGEFYSFLCTIIYLFIYLTLKIYKLIDIYMFLIQENTQNTVKNLEEKLKRKEGLPVILMIVELLS